MAQSLDLNAGGPAPRIRRLNRMPVIAAIVLVVMFFAVILYGLTTRGLYFRGDRGPDGPTSGPASTYADQMTRNMPGGIIEDPTPVPVFQPTPPPAPERPAVNPFTPARAAEVPAVESEEAWGARIEREQREQYLREQHRQRMARLQANNSAYDFPAWGEPGQAAERPARSDPTATATHGGGTAWGRRRGRSLRGRAPRRPHGTADRS